MAGAQHGTKRIGWAKHRDKTGYITTIRCGVTKDKIVFATEVYDSLAGPWPDGGAVYREGFLNIMCIAVRE